MTRGKSPTDRDQELTPPPAGHRRAAGSFEARLAALDTTLFTVESQTSRNDRRSLLACQLATRNRRPSYGLLEVGSYRGGTLVPHLRDPRCRRICSIDKRVQSQPDARGMDFGYAGNTRERMIGELQRATTDLDKLVCLDGDVSAIEPDAIGFRPDLFFIDGEHTDEAVVADFEFCRRLLAEDGETSPSSTASPCATIDGVVLFHDAHVIYNGIVALLARLEHDGVAFRAYVLPDSVMVVELGDARLHTEPAVGDMLVDNHIGYLAALRANDHYRRFATRALFRLARRLRGRFRIG